MNIVQKGEKQTESPLVILIAVDDPARPDTVPGIQDKPQPTEDGTPPQALRILVVEDDPMIGALLAEMLEEMGHEVCAIESTEADAVIAAARDRPQLMIVDIRLGDGSGVAAMAKIQRDRPVPHVFVSGDISRIRSLRPGAVALQKPYLEGDLVRAIQQALTATERS